MIIVSLLTYLAFSLFIFISLYGHLNLAKFIQVFFITSFGVNILVTLGLDLFNAIDNGFAFLLIQCVICILLVFLIRTKWKFSKKDYLDRLKVTIPGIKWFDFLLLFLLGAILSAFFVVGITTPPNNLDSLDPTGITRVFYWLQDGSISSSTFVNLPGFLDPKFLHIQGLWLFVLGKSEFLFFLVQWSSLLLATVTLYRISRSLNFSITNSLISAMVGLSLPIVLMQAYSFQGDLTVAVCILVSFSFVMDWLKAEAKWDLIAAGLSLVFALGTKKAAFLALPAIGIFILFWLISRIKRKKIVPWLMGGVAFGLLVFIFAVGNIILRHGGTFAGIPIIFDNQVSNGNVLEKVKYNAPRYLYQFIGLDGLPRVLQNSLNPVKADLFENGLITSSLDLQQEVFLQPGFDEIEKFSYSAPIILSEESAWFGPMGFLLLPIVSILALFSKQKGRRVYAGFGLLLFFSFFLMVIIQRPGWDPYQGRYFILPVLPLVPLVSIMFSSQKIWRTILMALVVSSCLFIAMNTFLTNNSRPIITAGSIWRFQYQHVLTLPENNKYQLYFKNKMITALDQIANAALDRRPIFDCTYWERVYYSGFRLLSNIQFIDPLVPNGATLYLNLPSTALDYGMFGKNKDRTLIRVEEIEQVASGYYLTSSETPITSVKAYSLLGDNGTYKIYLIKK